MFQRPSTPIEGRPTILAGSVGHCATLAMVYTLASHKSDSRLGAVGRYRDYIGMQLGVFAYACGTYNNPNLAVVLDSHWRVDCSRENTGRQTSCAKYGHDV